jgi:hypothetical protein
MGHGLSRTPPCNEKKYIFANSNSICLPITPNKAALENLSRGIPADTFAGLILQNYVLCPICGIGIWVFGYAKEKRCFNDWAGRTNM